MTALSAPISEPMVVAASHVGSTVGIIVAALVVAGFLVWMFTAGIHRMMGEPPRPKDEEHGHLPPTGPVHETRERREPEEVPEYEEEERLTPHRIPGFGNTPDRRSSNQKPRRWTPGNTGSFGSGGMGGRR